MNQIVRTEMDKLNLRQKVDDDLGIALRPRAGASLSSKIDS